MKTILIILVLAWATQLYATDYYVSPTGSDANSGASAGSPWRSSTNVNARAFVAGDRILFQGGQTNAVNLTFDSSDTGTTNNPIVISSYGTGTATLLAADGAGLFAYDTAGFLITNLNLVGTSRSNNAADQDGIFFYFDPSDPALPAQRGYVHVDHLDVSGFSHSGIWIGPYNSGVGLRDVRITNCALHDNGASGLLIDADTSYTITNVYVGNVTAFNNYAISNNSDTERGIDVGDLNDATIEHCVAYNNNVTGDGGAGFHVYDSTNTTVQRNESYNNHTRLTTGGSGFEINHRMQNSRIQYNYSHNNDGPGFWLLHEDSFDPTSYTNDIVRYNITENDGRQNGYAGIDVMGQLTSVEVHNNTIFLTLTNTAPRAIRVQNSTDTSLDVHGLHFRNNILQTTNGVRLVEVTPTQLDTATDLLFQGNDYYPSGGTFDITWNGTTYSTLDAWRVATGQEEIGAANTGTNINPRLGGPGNGNHQLNPNSPMIDHGLALSTLFGMTPGPVDFYSNSVPAAGGYDIGAYESTDPLPTSVTASNGLLNLKFARTRPPALELTYAGQVSSDLVSWCTSSCVTTQVVDNGDNTETVTIVDTVPISAANRRFLRVKITRSP
jgi:hypothetical protein